MHVAIEELITKVLTIYDLSVWDGVSIYNHNFVILFLKLSYVFIAARNKFPDQIVLHNEITDITTVTQKDLAGRRDILLFNFNYKLF